MMQKVTKLKQRYGHEVRSSHAWCSVLKSADSFVGCFAQRLSDVIPSIDVHLLVTVNMCLCVGRTQELYIYIDYIYIYL